MLLKNLSHQNHKILATVLPNYLTINHSVAIDDVVVNNGWSIPSAFLQQTVKQVEVIQEVVLSEVVYLSWMTCEDLSRTG